MKALIQILLTILSFIFVCQAQAQAITQIVAKAEKAIFIIYTYDEYGRVKNIGTGFFIDGRGTAVTNHHVLEASSKAIIKLQEGEMYEIDQIQKTDKYKDLTIFSIKNPNKKTFKFLTLSKQIPRKASQILVIGNPNGLESSFSEGNISAIRDGGQEGKIIQISAPISSGSSGSPVMDKKGNVIAVVTSTLTKGQNLNFAVAISEIAALPKPTKNDLMRKDDNLVILNVVPKGENGLTYNSIHFGKDTTTVYCSFVNTQIIYGDTMLVWAQLSKKDKGFYIQDIQSNEKYYILASTVGYNRDTGTKVKLGENKTFKIFFPPIPDAKRINIIEGSGNSNWSLLNIDLDYYKKEGGNDLHNIYKEYGLYSLQYNDYDNAIEYFNENLLKNKQDSESYNLMAVIAYLVGENENAIEYIDRAIQISPNDDVYYSNRFRVHLVLGERDKAINDLNLSIISNPTQPDYYYYRALLFMEKNSWKDAIKDLDECISKENSLSFFYYDRALCYIQLGDLQKACEDAQNALKLNPEDEETKEFIKENCTKKLLPKTKINKKKN